MQGENLVSHRESEVADECRSGIKDAMSQSQIEPILRLPRLNNKVHED